MGDEVVSAQARFPGFAPNQTRLENTRGVAFGYKAVLGTSMVNNLRYGYTRIGEAFAGVRSSEFVNLRFIGELNGFDGTASTRTRRLSGCDEPRAGRGATDRDAPRSRRRRRHLEG